MTIAINKRRKYLFWFLLAVTAIIAVCYAIDSLAPPTKDIQQFEREIAADLPLGTHRDTVEKWILARGFQPQMAEHIQNPGRVTGMSARVPKSNWLVEGEIYLRFTFDDNGRLIKSSVSWHTFSL